GDHVSSIAQEGKAVTQVTTNHLAGQDKDRYEEGNGKTFFWAKAHRDLLSMGDYLSLYTTLILAAFSSSATHGDNVLVLIFVLQECFKPVLVCLDLLV
ncbi:MAG: hypothetical protein H6Q53_391, partial [Deltaproteobacteria bacterium]|nr:hypothetical protein [Deltaproteobacteria bacterium]